MLFALFEFSSSAQSIDDLSFGTDSTFEVLTWNIDWMPKNGQATVDYLIEIIEALDVDLLAIQEVDEINDAGDEETRRYIAGDLLKDYVDTNLPCENTIILGDLNDILSDDKENNVFQMFLNDSENYLFADYEIAMGSESEWSYPTWPSHIDHMLISDELFDEFERTGSLIQTIKIDEYLDGGWAEYDENVSDHRPLALD